MKNLDCVVHTYMGSLPRGSQKNCGHFKCKEKKHMNNLNFKYERVKVYLLNWIRLLNKKERKNE